MSLLKITPVRFLSITNIASAALSLVQGILTARILGPASYGIIGIILAINTTVLNFLDIRLGDTAAKLFYQIDTVPAPDVLQYRASVLRICMFGNFVLSIIFIAIGYAANLLLDAKFTGQPILSWWILAQTSSLALAYINNTLVYLLRFSEDFYFAGTWKLLTQACSTVIFLGVLLQHSDLDSYFTGTIYSSLFSLTSALICSFVVWHVRNSLPLGFKSRHSALGAYRSQIRFLFWSNILGYVKMLHRGADTLLVGYFCDDRLTGVYRFARSITDGIYLLYDSMNQVYLPRFLDLLRQSAFEEYKRLARRIAVFCGAFTLIAVAGEILLLPTALRLGLANKYDGAAWPIIFLTIPFFFVAGIYTWLWPCFMHIGKLSRFTALTCYAVLLQYAIAGFCLLRTDFKVEGAALGYLMYDIFLMTSGVGLALSEIPKAIPFRRTSAIQGA